MTKFLTTPRASLAATLLLMVAMPQIAVAQISAPLTDLYACEGVADKADQLDCFLTETAKLRMAETAGELVAVEKENVEQFKRDFAEKTKMPKSRSLAIRSTTTVGANGYVRFTLENGEVWQQAEAARVRLGKAEPDMLVIKKGRMGGVLGLVNGKRPSFRVKQIK